MADSIIGCGKNASQFWKLFFQLSVNRSGSTSFMNFNINLKEKFSELF